MIGILHLSDYHNVEGRPENHPVLLNAFFKDLAEQLSKLQLSKVYLTFSGDIAQSADEIGQYNNFILNFNDKFNDLGITIEQRIVAPGNHDVSQRYVKSNIIEHEGVVLQKLTEQNFNDYISKNPTLILEKFSNYLEFQAKFSKFGISKDQIGGNGWDLTENLGIFCLNSALLSSGGLSGYTDYRRLKIDTRGLHKWVQESKTKYKILLMHHPLHWLDEASERELKIIIDNNFSLRLFGHEHEQNSTHIVINSESMINCCAPAFFSRKGDDLGYAIILIDENFGTHEIVYRQWTKRQKFVSGVNFSETDNGRISLGKLPETKSVKTMQIKDAVTLMLSKNLDDALKSFAGQPIIWNKPTLMRKPEMEKDATEDIETISIEKLIETPNPLIIIAPPQFGLTCLARYLAKEAWVRHKQPWLYLDSNELKPNAFSIRSSVDKAIAELLTTQDQVQCIVLDSISPSNSESQKIFNKLIECYQDVPIIAMYSRESSHLPGTSAHTFTAPNEYESAHLWPLPRNNIRAMVSKYNDITPIGDEDAVITRIISDLEVLNLHRTPLNCLTLLKASEFDFDESPVNRSEVIKRILFLLFNTDALPAYKSKPDLKDCEYVLGYFCESLLKTNQYNFSRVHFLKVITECCRDQFIDLELHVVFDVLNENNILVKRDGQFTFKFSFWIYYFAAIRMHHSKEFANFIFSERRYANHPELIEFYTGVDRHRDDALLILTNDLKYCREIIEKSCGFPDDFDPFGLAVWTTSDASLSRMKAEIEHGIQESNLPAEVKDSFADKHYDSTRPYNQSIRIISDSSVELLMNTLRASSKALRNSDYVSPEIRKNLLDEIMHSWEQLTVVLLAILPALAERGFADFDGMYFRLDGDFGKTPKERAIRILTEIPGNVIRWSQDDLLSQKMGPLLIDAFNREKVPLRRHEMMRLLIENVPRGWKEAIQIYIASVGKNSFYLLDTYRALRTKYKFSYVPKGTLNDLEYLIKMTAIKHSTGAKDPGKKLIDKVMPKLTGDPIIPKREID